MRPRIFFLLLTASALLVAGCGGSKEPSTDQASKAATATPAPTRAPADESQAVAVLEGNVGDASTSTDGGPEEVSPGGAMEPDVAQPTDKEKQGVGAGASCDQVDQLPAARNDPTVETSILCLLNGERSDRGLGPLKVNGKLGSAANVQAQDMVKRRYFSHENPEGKNSTARIKAAGYMRGGGRWTVGENLAWGAGELASARALVNAWMNSPPHRANILRPAFREIGLAIAIGTPKQGKGAPGATVATTFGVIRR